MVIVDWLNFNRVFVKIGMSKCGDGECGSVLFVEQDVAVVNVSCVEEVKAGLLQKSVVCGLPGMFDECDGYVA